MNALLWIVQILLAGVFFVTAAGKLFAFEKVVKVVESHSKGHAVGMTRIQAAVVAIAEVVGALGLLMPVEIFPPHLVILAAASWLALLMVAATIYHAIRRESATPSIVLFLLALFIIVGRWPR
ncbi:MAG: DoxX family protein [Terracidiphilus sp.]